MRQSDAFFFIDAQQQKAAQDEEDQHRGHADALVVEEGGEEAEQGIGYLDDGTMIVVEGARNKIGRTLLISTPVSASAPKCSRSSGVVSES